MEKTIQNLTKAFIGESQARNRYTFYAKIAKKEGYEQIALEELQYQASEIADDIASNGFEISSDKEVIAMIAYLQRLGSDIHNAETVPVK